MQLHENVIGSAIVDAAIHVHKELGPGLLESTYEHCLAFELLQRGFSVETQLGLPVIYHQVRLECGYRIDMRVGGKVIVEIKAIEALNDVHMAQVLTYLKLSGCKLGYLINFNVKLLKDGVRRVVSGNL